MLSLETIVSQALPLKRKVGIYFLLSGGRVVYVGQSVNIDARVFHVRWLREQGDLSWAWVPCERAELEELERQYIEVFHPPLNDDPLTRSARGLAGKKSGKRGRGRTKAVQTPKGVFPTVALAAVEHGISRQAGWLKATHQQAGWRFVGAPDVMKRPVGRPPNRKT
jgi:hypothetical protein